MGGLLTFMAIVVIEHLLTPSLDPLEHQVSEYVHADSGILMALGFATWSLSLAATGALVHRRQGSPVLAALLALAAVGMAIVLLFPTQTSAGEIPPGNSLTLTGHLHDLGSGLATLSLLAAAVLAALDGRRGPYFRWATMALVLAALVVNGALLAAGPSVGGLRQRLVLLIGCSWQFLLLRAMDTRLRTSASRS